MHFTGVDAAEAYRTRWCTQWHRGVFDAQRTDDAAETLREWLMADNYLQAKVEARVEDAEQNHRRVTMVATPGPRSRRVLLEFQGASGIKDSELHEVIKEQKLERQLFTDPTVVTELLQRLYREQGYLNAAIDKPRYEYSGDVARVVLPINEGPQFTVQDVTAHGNAALPTPVLLTNMPVVAGDPFHAGCRRELAAAHPRPVLGERLQRGEAACTS